VRRSYRLSAAPARSSSSLSKWRGSFPWAGRGDLDVFTRSALHLRRIFETLGIERRPRDVTDVHAVLAAMGAEDSLSEPVATQTVATDAKRTGGLPIDSGGAE
jgi:hypothetical protein